MPKVSFIIPTLNSEKTLGQCLQSIAIQDYPKFEIVVVDGSSRDSTISVASGHTSKLLLESGPLGRARQVGAENSDGEILGIFDSDIVLPSADWLRNSVELFLRDPKVGVVWPINRGPDNASCVARCYFNLWSAFLNERLRSNKSLLPGGNSLVLRRAFVEAGGFNPRLHFGEDLDLMHRIIRLGYRVVIPEYPIFHNSMRSLKEFTRKQLWGASSLIKASTENTTEIDLMRTCMTWETRKKEDSTSSLVGMALADHVMIGFKAMLGGVASDRCWLVFPIMISIRLMIYAGILLHSYFSRHGDRNVR